MKKLILISIFIITSIGYAQDVKYKSGKLLIDKVEVLSYKKTDYRFEYTFYVLNTTDDVFSLSRENNGTDYEGDDYTKLYFPQYKIKIESKSLWFGGLGRPVVEKLILEKVLGKDGVINEDRLKIFQDKYNDLIQK